MARLIDILAAFLNVLIREGVRQALERTLEYITVKSRKYRIFSVLGRRLKYQSSPPKPYCPGTNATISILMPVYNTPPDVLEKAIRSVQGQTYSAWELCICDDGSDDRATLQVLERFRGVDPRLKIVSSPYNLHIARATNLAAEYATGEFIAFLDHDDALSPDALERMADSASSYDDVDFLYSDEDKVDLNDFISDAHLKPNWSPDHLTSTSYILHFAMIRKSLFFSLGGLRHEYSGAQDYDLSLRASIVARRIVHVPHVLYHWRKIPGSAAGKIDAKPEALLSAKRALQDFVVAEDHNAKVEEGMFPGSFRVRWSLSPDRQPTLVMFTDSKQRNVQGRGEIVLVQNAVRSIYKHSTFHNFELIILDNGSMPNHVREELISLGAIIKIYNSTTSRFNLSRKLNAGADLTDTEDLIFLNDDIEVVSPGWIEALLEQIQRPEVGVAGARLLYPDNRIQHAGVVLGLKGPTGHIFQNQPTMPSYGGYSALIRNYSAVTGAVLATRKSVMRQVGAFDPIFSVDFNDVDFCLRVGEAGYRIVYTPFAELYHFEGGTITRSAPNPEEEAAFVARWRHRLVDDPYYHPRLPRNRTDCAI